MRHSPVRLQVLYNDSATTAAAASKVGIQTTQKRNKPERRKMGKAPTKHLAQKFCISDGTFFNYYEKHEKGLVK